MVKVNLQWNHLQKKMVYSIYDDGIKKYCKPFELVEFWSKKNHQLPNATEMKKMKLI